MYPSEGCTDGSTGRTKDRYTRPCQGNALVRRPPQQHHAFPSGCCMVRLLRTVRRTAKESSLRPVRTLPSWWLSGRCGRVLGEDPPNLLAHRGVAPPSALPIAGQQALRQPRRHSRTPGRPGRRSTTTTSAGPISSTWRASSHASASLRPSSSGVSGRVTAALCEQLHRQACGPRRLGERPIQRPHHPSQPLRQADIGAVGRMPAPQQAGKRQ